MYEIGFQNYNLDYKPEYLMTNEYVTVTHRN